MVQSEIRLYDAPLRISEFPCTRNCGSLVAFVPNPPGRDVLVDLKSEYAKKDEFMVVVKAPRHQCPAEGARR